MKGLMDKFDLLVKDKKDLIDFSCQRLQTRTFADLGGVWHVDGGYTFYAMEKHNISTAFMVDTHFTEAVMQKKEMYPGLKLIKNNFGNEEVAQQIGHVDAIIFFDTLLHQVNPNWGEVLEMYAGRTACFIIYNPQFVASKRTIRLLELGEEEYFKNVPHRKNEEPYRTVFKKINEIHPQHQRLYRDIHNIWQWGIVDDDLMAKMKSLGFTLQYYKNSGQFGELSSFENHGFVFWKSEKKYKYESP